MRNRLIGAVVCATAIVFTAFWGVSAQPPSGQDGAPGGRGRGTGGPPAPTPRLADGSVNLGRVAGEKGVWNVPYITNMG